MYYIIADKVKAAGFGISLFGHRTNGSLVIVNEKELPDVPGDTPAKKAKALGGKVYSDEGIKKVLKEGGWS